MLRKILSYIGYGLIILGGLCLWMVVESSQPRLMVVVSNSDGHGSANLMLGLFFGGIFSCVIGVILAMIGEKKAKAPDE